VQDAWDKWKTTGGKAPPAVKIWHPTRPESSSRGKGAAALAQAINDMLANWNVGLQTIEPSLKHPDVTVPLVPYEALLRSSETAILLVVINGVPRLGLGALMKALGVLKGESIRERHHVRVLNAAQETADPDVAKLRVGQATELLRTALKNLPALAAKVKREALAGVAVRRGRPPGPAAPLVSGAQ